MFCSSSWHRAAVLAALAGLPMTVSAPASTDHRPLLRTTDSNGRDRPIELPSEWRRRREQILAAMEKVMGPFPGPEKRVPLDVKVERATQTLLYVRKKITYQSAPGERVPAYLLLPRSGRSAPAVLCLHQTVQIGKDEPAGLGGNPNLRYAEELAERGYVVLAPDYPTLGEHQTDVYAHGWASGSMKAVWDNVRGIDLLQSLPAVNPRKIGSIGHSLGGHNTLFTAAFDARIRALVSNCGFTDFGKYYGGDLTGWTGPRYMPRIKTDFPTPEKMPFDFHDVVAAIAPRALLASAPLHDGNFEVSGVREVIETARPVYRLLGAGDKLDAVYPDCGHEWPKEMRERAYRWLDRWLKG
jgi:acetyl esterase/lipase